MNSNIVIRIIILFLILIFFSLGTIFLIASFKPGREYRLGISTIFYIIAIILSTCLLKTRSPKIMKVSVEWSPSGRIALEKLKCPNCGASLPMPKPGEDYVKCPYCGITIKITEEPKW